MPSQDLPSVELDNWGDKYIHVFLHLVFALLWQGYALRRPQSSRHNYMWVWCASLLWGITLEWAQWWMSWGRQSDAWDVGANAIGATLGLIITYLWTRMRT